MTAALFTPIALRDIALANRIVVSPMCQYSAVDGTMSDWHIMHLGQFAVSGAGLVFVEATGVEPAGRITPGCTGLYSEANEAAMARVVAFCKRHGTARMGVQLAHAGRKASNRPPFDGGTPLEAEEGAWTRLAPSALPFRDWPAPVALDKDGLARVRAAFADAARRAHRAGFDVVEIHGAHGYLLHQFLSPLSNVREDAYGGTLENRMRFPLEVFDAVRAAFPPEKPVGIRVSATDWVDGGWDIDGTVEFAHALKARGCDFIDVSSGGLSPEQRLDPFSGYQVPFAERIRRETGLSTVAVGLIKEPAEADEIVASGKADMVAMARAMLYDPRWVWHAAEALDAAPASPPQYRRAHPVLAKAERN